ncbi:MAG: LysR family transcriptional regulator [Pseudomonadota bacterium]
MMNLMHWRLLVAIADAGGISRAADRFGVTQSGASQAISKLEEMLGVRLLVRERRSTVPTAVGEQVIRRARAMLTELDAIQLLAGEAKGSDLGRVRLASFSSVFQVLLPPLLRSFRRQHPGIEMVALEASDEEVESWLASDAIDVGVVMNPDPARGAVPLGRDEWVVVAPVRHPFAQRPDGARVAFEDVVRQPFVLATGGCAVHGGSLAAESGLALGDLRMSVRDWASAYTLVRENMGVTLVPRLTLPQDLRGLRVLSLAKPLYRFFGLACSQAGARSRAVATFLDAVRSAGTGAAKAA